MRLSDGLLNEGFLTKAQKDAVDHPGDMLLVACPGGGKTRTGGARVAQLAGEGRSVAACSYTNVGVHEVHGVLARDLGVALGPRHFAGTLHGFLLKYVFYPFAHLVVGCASRPRLADDDSSIWDDIVYGGDHRRRLSVSKLRFRPDGSFYAKDTPLGMSKEEAANGEIVQVQSKKHRMAAAGYASFDDSMYWALRVLADHADVRRAVAQRFDEIIVDEAQDTSELQLACLEQICAGGLESLVLIGDIEQSIYSFQGASPEGCLGLANARGLERVELTENHRSSQLICNVAAAFCDRAPDRAVGETRDCPWEPRLLVYAPDDPAGAVGAFRDHLESLNLDPADAAVVARNRDFIDELNGDTAPVDIGRLPKAVGRACAAIRGHGTPTRRSIEALEKALLRVSYDTEDLSDLDPSDKWELRQSVMRMVVELPDLNMDLRHWIRESCKVLQNHGAALADGEPKKQASHVFKSSAQQEGHTALDAFTPRGKLLTAQTIHDVKGTSRDAVLVVLPPVRRGSKHAHQATLWQQAILGEIDAHDAEERRIAFVALSRARRYCVVAIPRNLPANEVDALEAAGFSSSPLAC